jgi:molybdopterin converting factor small subunit
MSGTGVLVRYWAAAKAAAGLPEERYPAPGDLAGLLDAVRERHGADARLAEVLRRCSYLVDEMSPGTRDPSDVPVPDGAVVDVLPPFAGGSGAHPEPSARRTTGTGPGSEGLAGA